ncbi:MAG: GSCFA domain-containing protein [Bacteroidales bacterium]|nr:GSCFA domain-containing protein [Bacteroidales bacterium]
MFINRTEIELAKSENQISHKDKLLFLGSCFAENIGKQITEDKFSAIVNPFGVLYNPISVLTGLVDLIDCKKYSKTDLLQNGNLWCSFSHHSSFSSVNPEFALEKINSSVKIGHEHLNNTKFIFLTFGTARVYRYIKTNKIVSNCHKFNAKEFAVELLSKEEIVNEYSLIIEKLRSQNPEIQIIFTVSPVRHLKDGFSENSHSKAILLLAIHELVASFNNCHYFPAYEIFMDDLRDYRYYAEDMIHPGNVGIKYLYEKFSQHFFNSKTINLLNEIRKVKQGFSHRILTDDKEAKTMFLNKLIEKAKVLEAENEINFSEEIHEAEENLKNSL